MAKLIQIIGHQTRTAFEIAGIDLALLDTDEGEDVEAYAISTTWPVNRAGYEGEGTSPVLYTRYSDRLRLRGRPGRNDRELLWLTAEAAIAELEVLADLGFTLDRNDHQTKRAMRSLGIR